MSTTLLPPADAPSPAAPGHRRMRVVRRVVAGLLGLVLLGVTGLALGIALYPRVTGGSALTVLSGSMAPGIPVGALVLTRAVDPSTVVVGDVVTYQRATGVLVTHRVVAVDGTGATLSFTTRGDANADADADPVPAGDVRGVLWSAVPGLGRFAVLAHSPTGAGVLVLLACAVLAVSPGRQLPRPADELPGPVAP
ncbi:signal peptidase I [Goekera deserti]|uniref:Signal peptidase I n=1 Tax=Goekera deserti TaxID=2497753 RepID=A0A7K3WG40_9ACTN|nr:signal peptidase I [Goekera deserti]NDI46895.1 signal peptidase I [Goekera deserti]NEL54463.1 signal peptidase I [Goekera deserti]